MVSPNQRGWYRKFADAFRGVTVCIRSETSFLVHIPVAVAVVAFALAMKLEPVPLGLLVLCIGTVIACELLNSSIERLARAITGSRDSDIRDALDIASGAVLVIAITAATTGVVVFATAVR